MYISESWSWRQFEETGVPDWWERVRGGRGTVERMYMGEERAGRWQREERRRRRRMTEVSVLMAVRRSTTMGSERRWGVEV